MKPPRTRSLWLTASASPGSSRRVGMKSSEALIWLARALGRFGHEEGGRLGELQPLGTLHPALDPLVDLVEELVHQNVRGGLLEHEAVGVDEAGVAPARDAEVGVSGFPRPVDGTAHDGDLEGLRVGPEALLDDRGEILHPDV